MSTKKAELEAELEKLLEKRRKIELEIDQLRENSQNIIEDQEIVKKLKELGYLNERRNDLEKELNRLTKENNAKIVNQMFLANWMMFEGKVS